jgi:hypothetical protein
MMFSTIFSIWLNFIFLNTNKSHLRISLLKPWAIWGKGCG